MHVPARTTSLVIAILFALCGAQTARADAQEDYVEAPKTLYVWNASTMKPTPRESNHHGVYTNQNNTRDRLAKFVKLHGFSKVYFFVGAIEWEWDSVFGKHTLHDEDDLALTVSALREAGADVHAMWYLNDDPNSLSNFKRAADIVETVHAYNERHPKAKLSGVHCDQEPSRPDAYADLKAMFELQVERNKELKAGLTVGASLKPLWLRETWQGRKLFEHLVDVLDETTLMAYNNNPATVKKLAAPLLAYSGKVGKPVEIAIETGTHNAAEEETFAGAIEQDPERFFEIVGDLADHFGRQDAFERIVIHAFSQYFKVLHAVEPDIADLEVDRLHGPLRSDAALPDAKLPAKAKGFVGKLKGKVVALGRTAFAFKVEKVAREASNSSAEDAETLEGTTVIVRAGKDETQLKWIRALQTDQEETVEVKTDGDSLKITSLSTSQKRAARKVD